MSGKRLIDTLSLLLCAALLSSCSLGQTAPASATATVVAPSASPATPTLAPSPTPAGLISSANVGEIVELARWGNGSLRHATYSGDGKLVATASTLGVEIYDAQSLEPLRSIATSSSANFVAFAPDGRTLASASYETIKLWDVAQETELCSLQGGHTAAVYGIAISPDGRTIASASQDDTIRLWAIRP